MKFAVAKKKQQLLFGGLKRKSCLHLRIMLTYFKSSSKPFRVDQDQRLNILTKSDRRDHSHLQLKRSFSMGRKLPSLIANDPWLLSASSSLLSMQDDLNKIFSWAKTAFHSMADGCLLVLIRGEGH